MPKISVIMVAWNSSPLPGAAVAGVRAQTGDRLLYLRSLFAWARHGWRLENTRGGAAKGQFRAALREQGRRTPARY